MRQGTAAAWFAVVSIAFAAAAILSARGIAFRDGSFKAFYCAGKAVSAHADPYRVEPGRACQHAIANLELPPAYVEPAPLPGFALALFGLLSRLPFGAAALVFALAVWFGAVVTALILAGLTRAPPAAILLVLLPLTLLNLNLGEIPPLATLALCGAAWAFVSKRWTLCGICVSLMLVEPHVGLPAVAAAVIFLPRTRIPVAATIVVLAVISFAAIGAANNVEYVRGVLPAQASSELVASDQYSLSRVLYVAGAHDRTALLFGEISYVLMAVIGVLLGRRASETLGAPALLLFVPPAAVLLGGVFMHDIQFMAALPAAITLAARSGGKWRLPAFIVLFAISCLWTQHLSRAIELVDAGAAIGAAAIVFRGLRQMVPAAAAAAAIVLVGLFWIGKIEPMVRANATHSAPFSASAGELSSTAWARYERATPVLMQPRFFQQAPTWIGLLLLLVCAAGAPSFERRRVPRIGQVKREPA